jgi:hypothetical protein
VGVEGFLIGVLLVDDDGVRFALNGVRHVRDAAGFLTGSMREGSQNFSHTLAVLRAKFHTNRIADHDDEVVLLVNSDVANLNGGLGT